MFQQALCVDLRSSHQSNQRGVGTAAGLARADPRSRASLSALLQ